MQLLVEFNGNGLNLPINYNHILQGIIYHKLIDAFDYSTFLHDKGFKKNDKIFKIFTFSKLQGHYKIDNRRIEFDEKVSLEVRSPQVLLIQLLADSMEREGLTFGDTKYEIENLYISDYSVEANDLDITMKTPICVYSTDSLTGFTTFFTPNDTEFYSHVVENFRNKYEAYYGVTPNEDIQITPLEVKAKDKCVTNFKGIYISGWQGKYRLSGKRKYLDFLYNTGLGGKNSQGFGMFDINKYNIE